MPRMQPRALILFVVGGLTAQRVRAQVSLQQPSLVGCYQLVRDSWVPELRSDSIYHRLPTRVRLDTTAASQGGWQLRPDIAYPRPSRFPGTPRWTINRDSVVLLWSNGFVPTRVVLRRVGPSLSGSALALSDAIGPGPIPRAAIRLEPVPCTSNPTVDDPL
jgi:hypothetical protein